MACGFICMSCVCFGKFIAFAISLYTCYVSICL